VRLKTSVNNIEMVIKRIDKNNDALRDRN
jgi:hypothetical protein